MASALRVAGCGHSLARERNVPVTDRIGPIGTAGQDGWRRTRRASILPSQTIASGRRCEAPRPRCARRFEVSTRLDGAVASARHVPKEARFCGYLGGMSDCACSFFPIARIRLYESTNTTDGCQAFASSSVT